MSGYVKPGGGIGITFVITDTRLAQVRDNILLQIYFMTKRR